MLLYLWAAPKEHFFKLIFSNRQTKLFVCRASIGRYIFARFLERFYLRIDFICPTFSSITIRKIWPYRVCVTWIYLIRIFDHRLSCPGLYGWLYGQNLPYKFKNSYGDFRNRNFEKSHRTTSPRSDLRPDSWSWVNSGLETTCQN